VQERGDAQGRPPSAGMISSPYDPDARYATKRSTSWTGYKVHLSPMCEIAWRGLRACRSSLVRFLSVHWPAALHIAVAVPPIVPRKEPFERGTAHVYTTFGREV